VDPFAENCLVRFMSGSGQVRYRLGERLVDRYLEFVAGRSRPDTLRAVAFDLKAFFTVIPKNPVEITAADVFEFLADQRGDRSVIRLADRESGLSARTIARRLSSVSGLYAYLVARGDTPVRANPVPRGLLTRRQGGSSLLWADGRAKGHWPAKARPWSLLPGRQARHARYVVAVKQIDGTSGCEAWSPRRGDTAGRRGGRRVRRARWLGRPGRCARA
jgi:Phage integrase, N-terminal SAM-like domain